MQSDAYLPRDRQPLLIHIPCPKAKLQTFSDLGKNFTLRHISLAKFSRFSFEKREHKPFCNLLTLEVNNSFFSQMEIRIKIEASDFNYIQQFSPFMRNLYRKGKKLNVMF